MKVSVIGVTGYGGLELIRILLNHPYVTIQSVHSQSLNGQLLSDVYPHLRGLADFPLEEVDPERIMAESDLVFFATPSGISKDAALPFALKNFPVVDLSGDYRLNGAGEYLTWYGKEGAPLEVIQSAEYGLAEFRDRPQATFIANPGCYATAAALSLAPLVQRGLIDPDTIIIDAKSGLSGAGKKPTETTHFTETDGNLSLYRMNCHQHIPEIVQQLKAWDESVKAIQFSTTLIPVTRGIFATTYARPKENITTRELLAIYEEVYRDKFFVRIQPEGVVPSLKQVVGSNFTDIGLAYNEATNCITVVTVIDNLMKGAAGQAVQNMNIIGGFPEEAGLLIAPLYP